MDTFLSLDNVYLSGILENHWSRTNGMLTSRQKSTAA